MRRALRDSDLLAILVLTAAAVATGLADSPPWARTFLDLPLLLLFPGYALVEALLGERAPDGAERLAWSLVASLAVAILVGIVVQTALALDRDVWIVSMAMVVAAATLATLLVRRAAPERSADAPRRARSPFSRLGGALTAGLTGGLAAVTLALAAGLAVTAIAIASRSAADARSQASFTALSLLPAAAPHEGAQPVAVTVENETGGPAHYKLQLEQSSHRVAIRRLVVADGATWSARILVDSSIDAHPVTATLWHHGHLYRRVYLRSDPSP